MKKITKRMVVFDDHYPNTLESLADNEEVLTAKIIDVQHLQDFIWWRVTVMLVVQTTEKEAKP